MCLEIRPFDFHTIFSQLNELILVSILSSINPLTKTCKYIKRWAVCLPLKHSPSSNPHLLIAPLWHPPPSPDNGELKYAAWDIRLDERREHACTPNYLFNQHIIPPLHSNTTEWPKTYLHHIDKVITTFILVYYTFNSLCLFLIGWRCTLNFLNQCLGRHLAANNTIIVSRSLKVTGNHFMFARFVLLADLYIFARLEKITSFTYSRDHLFRSIYCKIII